MEQMGYHANAIITEFIEEYYDEYTYPNWYRRTFQFLDSCVNTSAIKRGNRYEVDIFIDWRNLHYKIRDSKQVIEWANEGLHGGYDLVDTELNFWDDAMVELTEETKGVLVRDFVKFLEQRTGCKARVR